MSKLIIAISVILLLGASAALADTYTVELPELAGELLPYPDGSTASFDFGTSFLQIDEVHIQMGGTFTPGSAHGDGLLIPIDQWREVPPVIEVSMDPSIGICGQSLGPSESPFTIEEPLGLAFGATWDFLLDGIGEITADRSSPIMMGWVLETPPTAEISEAYLKIEGVIPEPSTLFFLAFGGLWIGRRFLGK